MTGNEERRCAPKGPAPSGFFHSLQFHARHPKDGIASKQKGRTTRYATEHSG